MLSRFKGLILLFSYIFCVSNLYCQSDKQAAFEWVFGDLTKFNTETIRKVLADKPGKRHYIDFNNDGKPEEVWFIDIDPRHSESKRPILVRVIDEDGDLDLNGEPDTDSDLYIADWNADGTVDAVIDYEDLDQDQDVDRMGLFYFDKKYGLRVWWSRDDGDDNLLWYDIDYTYYQQPCESFSHFGGDETFVSFYIKPGSNRWTSFFENPFLFYDTDKDGVTEEVIRVIGNANRINSVRWSFDADNDATPSNSRDYDVSISAYAPGWSIENNKNEHIAQNWSTLFYDDISSEKIRIRGFEASPILRRGKARELLSDVVWSRVLMTSDENDLNIAWNTPDYTIERWEGVIASSPTDKGFEMPGIGWPDCGPFNKRYEIILNPKSPNEYYFLPSDRRIHLKNSDKTSLSVDYDYDGKMDMYYLWFDTDKDGIVDKISIDTNGDGVFDDSWNLSIEGIADVKWTHAGISSHQSRILASEPENLYYLNKVLESALSTKNKQNQTDAIWNMIHSGMKTKKYGSDISKRLIDSDETILYYLSLSADSKIAALKKSDKNQSFWNSFDKVRAKGQTAQMTQSLINHFSIYAPLPNYKLWLSDLRKEEKSKNVAWNNTWLPPNWGWESKQAAYRCYDGHFDFFGKRLKKLIYPIMTDGVSYHIDNGDWGMDVIHVGKTGGVGGLVLYVDGKEYPVRNENQEGDPFFSASLYKETNDTITIESKVTGVGPESAPYTVYIKASSIAGRYDSPIEVTVENKKQFSADLKIAIVLNKLPFEDFFINEKKGIMGLWGFQEPEIGWIGTGGVYPANRFLYYQNTIQEHRVVLKYREGDILNYSIRGDWQRGHTFPISYGVKEWMKDLSDNAQLIYLK